MSDKAPSTTKTPAELLKEASLARAAAAQTTTTTAVADDPAKAETSEAAAPETAEAETDEVVVDGVLEEDRFPQLYQLPSAPCTISFKDRSTGVVYRRVFPDGVAKAETAFEHHKLESMARLGTCYYFQGVHLQSRSQKAPQPLGPDTHEIS